MIHTSFLDIYNRKSRLAIRYIYVYVIWMFNQSNRLASRLMGIGTALQNMASNTFLFNKTIYKSYTRLSVHNECLL